MQKDWYLISAVRSSAPFGVPVIGWNWLPPALYDWSDGELALECMQQNWEWLLPFKGKVLHSLPKIPGSQKQLHLPWEDHELPCGPHKRSAAQIAQELQHPVLTLVFFLQYVFDGECAWSHCRKGMEMSLPAYRSKWVVWECDPEKLLHSSLQWFSWRQFGCRGISMQRLFAKNWRKSVCNSYWSIILKHSCISGAQQWKSVAHSPN